VKAIAPRGPFFVFAFLHWVTTSRRHLAPAPGNLAGIGKPERGRAAKSHFPSPAVNGFAEHQLCAAVIPLHQRKPGPVAMFAHRSSFQKTRRQPVSRSQILSP
jgi:hypothetical protein